jgi:hypothetical protein
MPTARLRTLKTYAHLLCALLLVGSPSLIQASTSTGQTYAITSSTLNTGVADMASVAATGFHLSGAVGDTFASGSATGSTYALNGGFVSGVDIALGRASPAALSFASQVVGTSSALQSVTISNLGAAPLNLTSPVVSGDFGQANNCGAAVAAGQSCNISVIFTPTVVGARTGTLTFGSNAPGGSFSVALTGTGQAATTGGGGGGTGGGTTGSGGGDVPLPPWAYALLGVGLMAATLRAKQASRG